MPPQNGAFSVDHNMPRITRENSRVFSVLVSCQESLNKTRNLGLAVKWPKICWKTAETRCWKTAETQLLENGRNIWDCRKTAEISAVFKQSTVFVGKWPKFRPFSYNP